MSPPTRDEVLAKLRALVDGSLRPQDASAWAAPWVTRRDDEIDDIVVMEGLQSLYLADAPTVDRPLLYTAADYAVWMESFVAKLDRPDHGHSQGHSAP